jgi:hypothetical protein
MAVHDITNRTWVVDIITDEVRLRCSYRRRRKRIIQYTVQLEIHYSGQWQPAVRYDNAHGFCHRDTIHLDGSQEKTPVYYGNANDTFTHAIDDLRDNWQAHRARFLRETEHD